PAMARLASRRRLRVGRGRKACEPVNTKATSAPATERIAGRRSSPIQCFRKSSWISCASFGDTFHECIFSIRILAFPEGLRLALLCCPALRRPRSGHRIMPPARGADSPFPRGSSISRGSDGAMEISLRQANGVHIVDVRGRLVIGASRDRKSTRLNSSHDQISYAVFCL